jgi:hypothetical protein
MDRTTTGKPNQESISKYFARIESLKARLTMGTINSVDFTKASLRLLAPQVLWSIVLVIPWIWFFSLVEVSTA